jgi:hypothetical protein
LNTDGIIDYFIKDLVTEKNESAFLQNGHHEYL